MTKYTIIVAIILFLIVLLAQEALSALIFNSQEYKTETVNLMAKFDSQTLSYGDAQKLIELYDAEARAGTFSGIQNATKDNLVLKLNEAIKTRIK